MAGELLGRQEDVEGDEPALASDFVGEDEAELAAIADAGQVHKREIEMFRGIVFGAA